MFVICSGSIPPFLKRASCVLLVSRAAGDNRTRVYIYVFLKQSPQERCEPRETGWHVERVRARSLLDVLTKTGRWCPVERFDFRPTFPSTQRYTHARARALTPRQHIRRSNFQRLVFFKGYMFCRPSPVPLNRDSSHSRPAPLPPPTHTHVTRYARARTLLTRGCGSCRPCRPGSGRPRKSTP